MIRLLRSLVVEYNGNEVSEVWFLVEKGDCGGCVGGGWRWGWSWKLLLGL